MAEAGHSGSSSVPRAWPQVPTRWPHHRWRWAPAALFAAYALALAGLLALHEPWRDEVQAWLLARDSPTLGDLWRNTRYEGHPLLWHLLLWVLAKVWNHVVAIQLTHGLVAAAAASVLLFAAPFPLWLRGLLVFGYFPLYEYGSIARNYSLSMLGLWAAAATHRPSGSRVFLVLTSHASPMGVLLVPPAWWALFRHRRHWHPWADGLLLLCWLGAVYTCLPPPDYEHARGLFLHWDWPRAFYILRGLLAALLPLPKPNPHFWNTNGLLPTRAESPLAALVVLGGLVAGSFWLVRELRGSRLTLPWLAGSAILASFFYAKFPGTTRHHGFFFLWLVYVSWLAASKPQASRRLSVLLAPLALVSVLGTAVATFYEARYPFSGAKTLAPAVSQHCADKVVEAHPDWAASTLLGYLPDRQFFYLTRNALGTFVIWDLTRAARESIAPDQLLFLAAAAAEYHPVCVILNQPLPAGANLKLIAQSGPTIVPDEGLYLYLWKPHRP